MAIGKHWFCVPQPFPLIWEYDYLIKRAIYGQVLTAWQAWTRLLALNLYKKPWMINWKTTLSTYFTHWLSGAFLCIQSHVLISVQWNILCVVPVILGSSLGASLCGFLWERASFTHPFQYHIVIKGYTNSWNLATPHINVGLMLPGNLFSIDYLCSF